MAHPHTRGQTPPQYCIRTQEADVQATPYSGVSFLSPFQYSNTQPQFVPQFGCTNTHDLNKQAYAAPHGPTRGNLSKAATYQNNPCIWQAYYTNQPSMQPSSYQMSQPQPGHGLYTSQQIMFMLPPQYNSTGAQFIIPKTTVNFSKRMPFPAYQNSIPTTQQGLFQIPQQKTANFTCTYSNPRAVLYNQAAQQQNWSPSAIGVCGPGEQPTKKRECKVLVVTDPTSGKEIGHKIIQAQSTHPSSGTSGSCSMPVIGHESTELEASIPGPWKENQDPNEGTEPPDNFGAMNSTPTPPLVAEEVMPKVDNRIEDVDSSDASIAAKDEKSEKQKAVLKYKYKEEQSSPINPDDRKQYNRMFLLQLQYAPLSMMKPANLPDIPEIEKLAIPSWARSQRGNGRPRGSTGQTKHINLSIQQDIKLHHAKEAWKPTHRTDKRDQSEEELKSEELDKKVRSILVKIKPQNFETMVAKMQALEINSETHLKTVVDLVFENAVSKPEFSVVYANMCRCLSMFKVPAETKQGNVNFRALLLTRCQQELEKANSLEKASKRKKIKKAATDKVKQQMKEEMEYEEMKAKRRYLGNMKFIGELFKMQMLTENIMHDCVFKLLRSRDEQNLECLCILLKTIGKELDTKRAKPRMDQYFTQMQKLVTKKKLSSRVRFMLQDVIELRQIHQELAQEEQDWAIFVQNLPQAKPQKGRHGRSLGQPSGPMGGRADDWNTVSWAPLRTDQSIDPSKLSELSDSENIQYGPGGEAARLGWFTGSTGSGARSQEGERPNSPGKSKADKSADNGSHRTGGQGGFGRPQPPISCPTQESERENAIAYGTIIAQRSAEERSGGQEPKHAKTMELIDGQMESKTRAIMDEYLHTQDVREAMSWVQELSSTGNLQLFVYNALNQSLERSEVARRQTGLLLHNLVKQKVILVDTYIKGLNEILMHAEDMEIDIPKFWEYLGQLIGPMVQDGSVPLDFLKQVCEPLRTNSKSSILIAEILHDASHREKLEFTRVGNSASTIPATSMAIPKIEESLNDLITNKGCSNEGVFDWIEGQVDEPTTKKESFIHALMTAVCRSAVTVSSNNLMKVDKNQIQRRKNLLQKYLDHQTNFELQALFTLQALVHKLEHPPGVLRDLFDILYDEDIVSEDAFIQWKQSEDPQEQKGKSAAMKQVVQFFTWLKEAKDDAES